MENREVKVTCARCLELAEWKRHSLDISVQIGSCCEWLDTRRIQKLETAQGVVNEKIHALENTPCGCYVLVQRPLPFV